MTEFKVRALEGIDGSGKSDTGQIVAAETGGQYFYFSDGNPLKSLRKPADRLPTLARFFFYIAMPLLNIRKIEQMRQTSDVFIDRTIFATIAYHRAYGLPDYWTKAIPRAITDQFDGMIYFSVSEEERKRRLFSRQSQGGIMTMSDQKSFDLGPRLDQEYRRLFDANTIEISTNGKTQHQAAAEVIEKLYGKKN